MSEPSHGPRDLDAESIVDDPSASRRTELRLWLRVLTCTKLIEGEIRRRLREAVQTTLPRFDLMAQLERVPDGLLMVELSQRLMVTKANLTGLVERLVQDGLVLRVTDPNDRRAAYVRLTEAGRSTFALMADAHALWVADLFSGVTSPQQQKLWRDLGRLKASVRQAGLAAPGPSRWGTRRRSR